MCVNHPVSSYQEKTISHIRYFSAYYLLEGENLGLFRRSSIEAIVCRINKYIPFLRKYMMRICTDMSVMLRRFLNHSDSQDKRRKRSGNISLPLLAPSPQNICVPPRSARYRSRNYCVTSVPTPKILRYLYRGTILLYPRIVHPNQCFS